jgi:predicted DNA-binding protein (UPF0251 family)
MPGVTYFKPAGIPLRTLQEIHLTVEEAEAIRLKDLEGLEQEEGAGKMNISRPTFQRVLASARHKIASALLNGKAIKIEGGNFEMSPLRFRCANGHEWEVPFEAVAGIFPQLCPTCKTTEIVPLQTLGTGCSRGGYGRGSRGRRGWQESRISTSPGEL